MSTNNNNTIYGHNSLDGYNLNGGNINGNIVYNSTPSLTDEQKAVKAIVDLQQTIKERMLVVQGLLVEMQRESGKHMDFNESFYKRLEKTDTAFQDVTKNIKALTEQLQYTQDMLDAIKTSQEIADGYKEYNDRRKNLLKFNVTDWKPVFDSTINTVKYGSNILTDINGNTVAVDNNGYYQSTGTIQPLTIKT